MKTTYSQYIRATTERHYVRTLQITSILDCSQRPVLKRSMLLDTWLLEAQDRTGRFDHQQERVIVQSLIEDDWKYFIHSGTRSIYENKKYVYTHAVSSYKIYRKWIHLRVRQWQQMAHRQTLVITALFISHQAMQITTTQQERKLQTYRCQEILAREVYSMGLNQCEFGVHVKSGEVMVVSNYTMKDTLRIFTRQRKIMQKDPVQLQFHWKVQNVYMYHHLMQFLTTSKMYVQ